MDGYHSDYTEAFTTSTLWCSLGITYIPHFFIECWLLVSSKYSEKSDQNSQIYQCRLVDKNSIDCNNKPILVKYDFSRAIFSGNPNLDDNEVVIAYMTVKRCTYEIHA